MILECQKVYLLTLLLHGIFYYIFLSGARNFFVLRQISNIFFAIWVNFDAFFSQRMKKGILSKGTPFDNE